MKQQTSRALAATILASLVLAGCGGAEQRFARSLERGQQYLAEGNYAKARVEFSNALQIDPNNAEVVYLSGKAAEQLGEYRPAAASYMAALNVDATYTPAQAAMGRLYLFSGLPDEAQQFVDTGLQTAPDDADLLALRAAVHAARGEGELARAEAERVVGAHPGHEQAVALLAGLYEDTGETGRALDVINRALELIPESVDLRVIAAQLYQAEGDIDRAESELKRVVALDPESPLPRQSLAQFYLSVDREAEAESVIRELIAVSPDTIEPKLTLVRFRLARESFDAAEEQLKLFIEENPDNQDLELALGELYLANNLSEDAEAHYRGMIGAYGRESGGLRASTRLATLLLQADRAAEAQSLIDSVLLENPRDNDALVLRAHLAAAKGDALTAITDLRAVLRDQRDNPAIYAALARAHVLSGDVDLARENYGEAVARDAGNSELRIEFAEFLGRRGETEAAAELLSALLAYDPQNLPAIETLFQVRLTEGDMESARQAALQAVESYPNHPLGYYLMGQYHELSGTSPAQAIAAYEQSLEKEPRGAEPLGAIARVMVTTGDRTLAKARVARVVEEQPGHGVALNLLAELELADREFEAAIRHADEAIAAVPGWWIPHRTKALARNGLGDFDGVRAAFEEGLAATGGAPQLGMDLAALFERANQTEEAIRLYDQLVIANPRSEVLANNLAMLLSTYRTDPASFERAADLTLTFRNSDVPAYLNTYGWVRYKQGKFDEAVSYLQRAVSGAPDRPVMRYHLGMALLESGNVERAKTELAAAIATDQSFPGKDEAEQALAEIERPRG